jgi:hypothetical protein
MSFRRRLRRRVRKEPKRPPVEVKGNLLGKHLVVTGESGTTEHRELESLLRQYNLTFTLRRLGELAGQIEGSGDRRQLLLQLSDNYSCRVPPGGWTSTATTSKAC